MLPNFPITPGKYVSDLFLEKGITTFHRAIEFIHALPFRRNSDKNDTGITIKENCGTCGAKHATLAQLAIENNHAEIQLTLGIYRMNGKNTPLTGPVLAKYDLEYIPEAHNYLTYNHTVYDYTFPGSTKTEFVNSLMFSAPMPPGDIGDKKVEFHKEFIAAWIKSENIQYSPGELWAIREECIAALSR
ncbi:MAG TPA: hypothetical protein VEC12_15870 [Bacteroidia bacterium]|nr:hypothetical protein [Bacteroidia bacterium]